VIPTYGTTETASQIATARSKQAFENPGSVGNPLFLTEVRIVDEAGDPLPPGEAGEIVVDGPTVTPGYYGDPAATEAAFGEFGLHTGDVGVLSRAGTLTVLNRLDDRILTGGETVEPGAVAEVLAAHPDVAEAAVVGVPDPEWGERVSALLVPGPGVSAPDADPESTPRRRLDPDDVTAFARDRLAAYKLPKSIAVAESLPRTVSGTVDRAVVRDRFTGDAPGTGGGGGDSDGSGGSGDDPRSGAGNGGDGDPDDDDADGAAADADRDGADGDDGG
jgi:O-succinylbenzoic acid--CoA ligase